MNSLSIIFTFVLSTVLQQSRCNLHYDRILFADWEPRNSLACFRTSTLDLFKNLKSVVEESCIREGEEEFRSRVNPRDSTFRLIIKNGLYHEQFLEGMKVAAEIGTQTIEKIHEWLSKNCSDEKQQRVNHFIKIFRKERAGCGDSNYLSSATTTLEQTCAIEEKGSISDDFKSYNDISDIHEKHEPYNWSRANRFSF